MELENSAEWKALEGFRKEIVKGPLPTFHPTFTAKVMRQITNKGNRESSSQGLYRGLTVAFSRISLAGLAMIFMLCFWIGTHSNEKKNTGSTEKTLEQEMEAADYLSGEELI